MAHSGPVETGAASENTTNAFLEHEQFGEQSFVRAITTNARTHPHQHTLTESLT